MATSNLILSEDKVTIICRDVRIFRFHIILAGCKMNFVVLQIKKTSEYHSRYASYTEIWSTLWWLFSIVNKQTNLAHSQCVVVFWRELQSGTQVAPGQPVFCVSQHSWPQCLRSEILWSGPCLRCSSALGLHLSTPSCSPSSSPYTMVHEEAVDFCLGLLSSETVPPTCSDHLTLVQCHSIVGRWDIRKLIPLVAPCLHCHSTWMKVWLFLSIWLFLLIDRCPNVYM